MSTQALIVVLVIAAALLCCAFAFHGPYHREVLQWMHRAHG